MNHSQILVFQTLLTVLQYHIDPTELSPYQKKLAELRLKLSEGRFQTDLTYQQFYSAFCTYLSSGCRFSGHAATFLRQTGSLFPELTILCLSYILATLDTINPALSIPAVTTEHDLKTLANLEWLWSYDVLAGQKLIDGQLQLIHGFLRSCGHSLHEVLPACERYLTAKKRLLFSYSQHLPTWLFELGYKNQTALILTNHSDVNMLEKSMSTSYLNARWEYCLKLQDFQRQLRHLGYYLKKME